MTKKCPICGRQFQPKKSWKQKYCSEDCKKQAKRIYNKKYRNQLKNTKNSCIGYNYYCIPVEICLNCNRKRCKYDQ